MFGIFRYFKRKKLRTQPHPAHWEAILEKNVPFYNTLAGDLKARFFEQLKIFIAEKYFIGAKDFEITDEVRVTIAASAVRLTLMLDIDYYDKLTEIVVYPYTYRHPEMEGAILGEAHTWGTVVLSWPAVIQGLKNPDDGHDTATHEFAHVLDNADGSFDGTPILRRSENYQPWAQVMSDHYFKLQQHRRKERKVMRDYGATNEAEFFAVATESFFEKPHQMQKNTPDLYDELKTFYGLDPAAMEDKH